MKLDKENIKTILYILKNTIDKKKMLTILKDSLTSENILELYKNHNLSESDIFSLGEVILKYSGYDEQANIIIMIICNELLPYKKNINLVKKLIKTKKLDFDKLYRIHKVCDETLIFSLIELCLIDSVFCDYFLSKILPILTTNQITKNIDRYYSFTILNTICFNSSPQRLLLFKNLLPYFDIKIFNMVDNFNTSFFSKIVTYYLDISDIIKYLTDVMPKDNITDKESIIKLCIIYNCYDNNVRALLESKFYDISPFKKDDSILFKYILSDGDRYIKNITNIIEYLKLDELTYKNSNGENLIDIIVSSKNLNKPNKNYLIELIENNISNFSKKLI